MWGKSPGTLALVACDQTGCQQDKECHTGGCGAEICSADIDATSSCDVQDWPIKGATCGCVAGECLWFRTVDPEAGAKQGDPCPDNKCQVGLTCLSFYGIAGPSGPKLTSCEIPCGSDVNAQCPDGMKCTTIADGPGQVCRPDPNAQPTSEPASQPASQPASP